LSPESDEVVTLALYGTDSMKLWFIFRKLKSRQAMMQKTSCILLWGLLISVFEVIPANGASITGKVFSEEFGYYPEGAEVRVLGTGKKASTERGGRFFIRGLPVGTYEVEASYPGFLNTRKKVELKSEEDRITLRLVLPKSGEDLPVYELETFEVKGKVIGSAKAIAQQKAADNLRTIVASDAFGQFTDRNAAEALQRLPGVSISQDQGEGTFVTIRGAAPELNSVSIDGVFAATPEEGGRSTSLNIISIDQLEAIEVTKSWLPDQWANFIGGSVNLITRSALDREQRFASVEGAYGRHDISDEDSFRLNAVYGDVFSWGSQRIGVQISFDQSENNRGSHTLSVNGYETDPDSELVGFPKGLRMEGIELQDFRIERQRVGFSAKVEFEPSPDHKFTLSVSRNRFENDEVLQETRLDAVGSFSGRFLTAGNAEAIGLDPEDPDVRARINDLDKMTYAEHEALGLFAFDEATKTFQLSTASAAANKFWERNLVEDTITTAQFDGDHRFGDLVKLEYTAYFSNADKEEDVKGVLFRRQPRSDEVTAFFNGRNPIVEPANEFHLDPSKFQLNNTNPSNSGNLRNNLFDSEDERYGGNVDLVKGYNWHLFDMISKGGFAVDLREKTFLRDFNRFSDITLAEDVGNVTLAKEGLSGGPFGKEFLPAFGNYQFGPTFDTDGLTGFVANPGDEIFVEQSNNDVTRAVSDAILRNFEATEDLTAGYFMQTLDWEQWRFIAGLRFERTENTFTNNEIRPRSEDLPPGIPFAAPAFWKPLLRNEMGGGFIEEIESGRAYEDWLPAFHIIREMSEQIKLRGAYTRTLRRPQFDDLVPRLIPSVDGASFGTDVRLPNFDLQPMESENFDFSFQYYFEDGSFAGINLFHKNISNVIFTETRRVQANEPIAEAFADRFLTEGQDDIELDISRQANSGDGTIQGVELIYQRRLDVIADILSPFSVDINMTFNDSEVELLLEERFGETVPLFQQPDFLANFSLIFQYADFTARLSLNHRGSFLERVKAGRKAMNDLAEVGLPPDSLDVTTKDFTRLDLFLQYAFSNNLSVFFEGLNLTNETKERYFGEKRRVAFVQETKPSFFIGLQWRL